MSLWNGLVAVVLGSWLGRLFIGLIVLAALLFVFTTVLEDWLPGKWGKLVDWFKRRG